MSGIGLHFNRELKPGLKRTVIVITIMSLLFGAGCGAMKLLTEADYPTVFKGVKTVRIAYLALSSAGASKSKEKYHFADKMFYDYFRQNLPNVVESQGFDVVAWRTEQGMVSEKEFEKIPWEKADCELRIWISTSLQGSNLICSAKLWFDFFRQFPTQFLPTLF